MAFSKGYDLGIATIGACGKCKRTATLHSGQCGQCKGKEMGADIPRMEPTIQPLGRPASATCDGCGAPTQTTAANCNHCGRPVRFDLQGVSRMTAEQLEKTKQEFIRRYGIPKSLIDGTTSGGPG